MSELSDQMLLRAYLKGDRGAFDALFRRYAARIHATAYRLTANWEDAEDTLQDVFVQLSQKAGMIRHAGAVSSWLYRTAVNRAADRLRRRRSTLSLDQPTPATTRVIVVESLRRDAERELSRRRDSLLEQIESLIPRLPERQASVFVLRYSQGLSHREIGSILGCSEGSSKSHLSLACRRLRSWIAKMKQSEKGAQAGREHNP